MLRCTFAVTCLASAILAAEPNPAVTRAAADYVPDVRPLVRSSSSELRELVQRFVTDSDEMERFFGVKGSALHQRRMREFYQTWQTRLAELDFERLDVEGRIDVTLLRTRLAHELRLIDRAGRRLGEIAALVPVAEPVAQLQEARRFLQPVNAPEAAAVLDRARKSLERTRAALEAGLKSSNKPEATAPNGAAAKETVAESVTVAPLTTTRVIAFRAVNRLGELRRALREWFEVYDGYDPAFGWWTREPFKQLEETWGDYEKFLREKIVGIDPRTKVEPIVGYPIGREALLQELANEMIADTPEELIGIAEREFAWVDREFKRAAGEMGFGENWKAALEKVKTNYVEPGQQPALVRELALEATRFVTERELVTVPPLAADVWLLRMLSRDRQREAPFFLGGTDIHVAFPTEAMTHEEKMQSLRANNRHFSRATVFHELVPGHHLQFYALPRFNPHRQLFRTPFWMEGWALWWEFRLWDLKFFATPEDRMGTLFWRAHRCARIIFSLKFHLGEWTPEQCIDFLVEQVGHERASATAEVRRSFNGSWSALYQAAYMLGALQIRALHAQLVTSGRMSEKQFHDAILQGGTMPIEMVRARLTQERLAADFRPTWRFAE